MRKFMIFGLFAAFIGFAFADDIADRQTVTSLTYVNDELSEKQDIFGAQSGTKVATFTNTAGEITPREVKSDLGNNTNDTALPTVSAVNTGLDATQDTLGANKHADYVATYTNAPGELGEKGIYQDSGTYAEQQNALVDAGTFNAALQNGLDNEFVCANRPDAYDPVTGNCWLWEIHNKTENKSPNLFNVSKIASSPSYGFINNGDGTITATSGANNSNVGCTTLLVGVAPSLEVGKQYVLSFKKTRYGLDFIQLQFRQTNPYSYQRWYNNTSIVITPEMLGNSTYVCFGVSAGSHTATIYDIQIEEGTTPTPFQPYNANIYLPENQ